VPLDPHIYDFEPFFVDQAWGDPLSGNIHCMLLCFDIGYKDSLDNVKYKAGGGIQVTIVAELLIQWNE
jgi:hypothetical protein